jgi:hypothetical protein
MGGALNLSKDISNDAFDSALEGFTKYRKSTIKTLQVRLSAFFSYSFFKSVVGLAS